MDNAMTVRQLIERLQQADPDSIVVLSRDAEGNGYSPCANIRTDQVYVYWQDAPWHGEVYPRTLTDEMRSDGWTDDDTFDSASLHGEQHQSVVVLWPFG